MPTIDKFFHALKRKGASDLHILAGQPPKFRIHGELRPAADIPALSNAECREILYEILNDRQQRVFDKTKDLDFAYELEGVARFRCNYFYHQHGVGAVFRIIPTEILSVDKLGVPKVVESFAGYRSGLVLVTGPTGSGKSTTLAAIIDFINRNYKRHIITVEDPIEFVHDNKKSVVTQREVGVDTATFATALKAAMREDPDVVLVGEMRDLETISLAITAAEMGNLVFGTLHTNSAAKTIDRVIDAFPEEQQEQVRTMLAVSLQAVLSQLLMRRTDKDGRVPVCEILLGSSGLSNIIREGAIHKVISYIEGGRGRGMQLMDDAIMARLKEDVVSADEAYMKASDKSRFQHLVSGK